MRVDRVAGELRDGPGRDGAPEEMRCRIRAPLVCARRATRRFAWTVCVAHRPSEEERGAGRPRECTGASRNVPIRDGFGSSPPGMRGRVARVPPPAGRGSGGPAGALAGRGSGGAPTRHPPCVRQPASRAPCDIGWDGSSRMRPAGSRCRRCLPGGWERSAGSADRAGADRVRGPGRSRGAPRRVPGGAVWVRAWCPPCGDMRVRRRCAACSRAWGRHPAHGQAVARTPSRSGHGPGARRVHRRPGLPRAGPAARGGLVRRTPRPPGAGGDAPCRDPGRDASRPSGTPRPRVLRAGDRRSAEGDRIARPPRRWAHGPPSTAGAGPRRGGGGAGEGKGRPHGRPRSDPRKKALCAPVAGSAA